MRQLIEQKPIIIADGSERVKKNISGLSLRQIVNAKPEKNSLETILNFLCMHGIRNREKSELVLSDNNYRLK